MGAGRNAGVFRMPYPIPATVALSIAQGVARQQLETCDPLLASGVMYQNNGRTKWVTKNGYGQLRPEGDGSVVEYRPWRGAVPQWAAARLR